MGGYLLSNKKLREELMKAKDAEDAAKSLGKHLQRDGKKIAQQVREFVESEEVQSNVDRAKAFTRKKADEAKKELKNFIDVGTNKAKAGAKRTAAKAKKSVKSSVKKAKAAAKKTAGNTAKRMKTKTRRIS